MQINKKKENSIKKLVLSSVFLSLAVIMAVLFSLDIPLFGVKGIEVSLAGIFTTFPAILFGPLYGGIVAGLTDLLSYIIKPNGAYIPWLTLTSFLGGFLKGVLWILIKKSNNKHIRVIVLISFVLIGTIGIYNHVSITNDNVSTAFIAKEANVIEKSEIDELKNENKLSFASKTADSLTMYAKEQKYTSKLAENINLITVWFEVASVFGLSLCSLDYIYEYISKKKGIKNEHGFLKILLVILIPGLIVTTINTQILISFITVLNGRAFLILWIPRLIEEFIIQVIQAYFISILYGIYKRYIAFIKI